MMKIITFSSFTTNNLLTAIFVPGFLLLTACGGGSGEAEKVQLTNNQAPDVNAGQDQAVAANDEVRIAASASDSDGTIETYSWTQISGTSVSLSGSNTANASFRAPTESGLGSTQLSFRVTATDDKGASATDTVDISISQPDANMLPTVSAGDDVDVNSGSPVNFSASASDSDGTIQSYSWTQTSGANVDLDITNSTNLSFTAPSNNSQSNLVLSFSVTVIDNDGATASDSVSVNVAQAASNQPPTANAGQDQSVQEGDTVNLNASAADSDGSVASYSWSQLSGTSVNINSANSASASFTAPTVPDGQEQISVSFQVLVTDNNGASVTDSINVLVTANNSNQAPSTDAGQDQSVEEGVNVNLSANASDNDGTIESYSWAQLSGASVNLSSADSANASFVAPEVPDGQEQISLAFEVLVTDDDGATATDSVTITVLAPVENIAPTVSAGNDATVFEQTGVSLVASAEDSDGSISSYSWSQTSGNTLSLTNANTSEASFTSPTLADVNTPESYTFEITVTDDQGLTATDSISITVRASASTDDCTLTISPGTLFTSAFAQLSPGQTLCLNDGIYVQAMDIPSDINVRAVNDGMAEIDGGNTRGEEWSGGLMQMKGSNSSVRGLKVYDSSTNSDTCHIAGSNNTMKVMSCSHGGSHKHKIPMKIAGSGHLIEGSWFYGEGRYVVQCFGGNNVTLRGNVIRWDETVAGEESEPNAAMSNYSCSDMIWENNISIDYGIPETYMIHCGDMCMSTTTNSPNYRVQYLGNMVINHDPSTGNNKAFRADQKGSTPSTGITIKDFYVRSVNVGIVFNPIYDGVIIDDCTMTDVSNNGFIGGQSINCNNDADIQFKYVDGVKTTEALWPWPNEGKIKADMCASDERQSDWCNTNKSLSEYILE